MIFFIKEKQPFDNQIDNLPGNIVSHIFDLRSELQRVDILTYIGFGEKKKNHMQNGK